MDFAFRSAPRPPSVSFSLKSSQSAVSSMTLDVESTIKKRQYITLFPGDQSSERDISEAERNLKNMIEKRSLKYGVPSCLKRQETASLYKAIIAYTLFAETQECDRLKIFEAVNELSGERGVTSATSNLSSSNIIQWASKKFNLGRVQAALVLGDMVHLKPERCFSRFSSKKWEYPKLTLRNLHKLPRLLNSEEDSFTLRQSFPIRSIDGRIIQVACLYSFGEIPVTVYADTSMRFGAEELPAILPALDLIEADPKAVVHFCICADILWKYISLAREGKLAEREGVVVTGSFGALEDLDALDLSTLLFHPVVIVCPKDRPEYRGVDKFAERCLASGAESVRIFSESLAK